jgi:hypothetical protein
MRESVEFDWFSLGAVQDFYKRWVSSAGQKAYGLYSSRKVTVRVARIGHSFVWDSPIYRGQNPE